MGDNNHGTMDRFSFSYDLGIYAVDGKSRDSTLGLATNKCIVHDMGIRRHKGQGHCTRINGSGILYTSSAGCNQLVALNAGLFQEYDYNNEHAECDWRQ